MPTKPPSTKAASTKVPSTKSSSTKGSATEAPSNESVEPTPEKIGHGHPPAKHRFQKGQSGNPKGRPPRSRNIKTDLREALNEELTVMVGGKSVRMPAHRVMVLALRNKAANGDLRALAKMLELVRELMPEVLADDVKAVVSPDDLAIFGAAAKRCFEAQIAPEPITTPPVTPTDIPTPPCDTAGSRQPDALPCDTVAPGPGQVTTTPTSPAPAASASPTAGQSGPRRLRENVQPAPLGAFVRA